MQRLEGNLEITRHQPPRRIPPRRISHRPAFRPNPQVANRFCVPIARPVRSCSSTSQNKAVKESVSQYFENPLGTAVEAEDAAQETFLRAFSQIKSYKTQYKFIPWLLSIASHYCIDRLRRGKRWRWLSLDDEPAGEMIRAETPGPEESALSNERAEQAQMLLQKLPPAYRLVVTLKYWNEMSVEEIARVVNESVANVKVKLYRARLMMAQEYASETQTQLRPVLQGVSDAS